MTLPCGHSEPETSALFTSLPPQCRTTFPHSEQTRQPHLHPPSSHRLLSPRPATRTTAKTPALSLPADKTTIASSTFGKLACPFVSHVGIGQVHSSQQLAAPELLTNLPDSRISKMVLRLAHISQHRTSSQEARKIHVKRKRVVVCGVSGNIETGQGLALPQSDRELLESLTTGCLPHRGASVPCIRQAPPRAFPFPSLRFGCDPR
mmetsp:Transcript_42954/g.86190  ORF Transcript_42954/g.86190 Transcript_42954/m.86190 type:complete len:206 (-) Transcript_42954:511-1128(-)